MKRMKRQERNRFKVDQAERFLGSEFSEVQNQNRDERLTDNIERAIEGDSFLSAVIDNIQVIVNSGVVTLEGVVFTEQERRMVEEKAAIFAGSNNINNNLEVVDKD